MPVLCHHVTSLMWQPARIPSILYVFVSSRKGVSALGIGRGLGGGLSCEIARGCVDNLTALTGIAFPVRV